MTIPSSNPRLLYLNALFDLELGGYPIGSLARSAHEMMALFTFAGGGTDRVVLDCEVLRSYWEYLAACGASRQCALPYDGARDETVDSLFSVRDDPRTAQNEELAARYQADFLLHGAGSLTALGLIPDASLFTVESAANTQGD